MPWRNAPFASDHPPLPGLSLHRFELTDDVCVLTVRGELDLSTTGLLEHALAECGDRGCTRIILDLSPLRFIDCTGVDLLTTFQRTLPSAHTLVLAEPPPAVRETLALTDLARDCDIFERLDEHSPTSASTLWHNRAAPTRQRRGRRASDDQPRPRWLRRL